MTGFDSKRQMAADKDALFEKLEVEKPAQEPVSASAWWTLVMCAAAEIENASTCLRDEDAKRCAISGAKYYRDAAKALWATQPLPAQPVQPVQEPVAWIWKDMREQDVVSLFKPRFNSIPLYTTPPKREWVGLTDEDIVSCSDLQRAAVIYFSKKLKEKNT
jgi:hypothetical protein